MKQTAVEWLIEEYFGITEYCSPAFRKIIEQAKQMEKEQIVHAYNHTILNLRTKDGEQYYNETYKKKEK